MNPYKRFFLLGFKKSIEYKANIINHISIPLIIIVAFYVIWEGIYQKAGPIIGGLTFEQMTVYFVVTTLMHGLNSEYITKQIDTLMSSGNIVNYMTRPINFLGALFFRNFGQNSVNILVKFILVLLISTIFVQFSPNKMHILLFLIYLPVFVLFNIALYSTIGLLSFWITKTWGISDLFEMIQWVLGGALLPLTLFPEAFQGILKLTPFYYLQFTAAQIYLSQITTAQALVSMAILIGWSLFLLVIAAFMIKKGMKKLEIFGG